MYYNWCLFLAYLPGPVVAGGTIDAACVQWNTDECKRRGNCLLYNNEQLRIYVHVTTGAVRVLACIFYAIALLCAKGKMFGDDDEPIRLHSARQSNSEQLSVAVTHQSSEA